MLKQRNGPTNGLQANKFKLPSIFGQKSTDPISSSLLRPVKFNNLSELANAHLSSSNGQVADQNPSQEQSQKSSFPQEAQNRSKFIIPKLSGGSGSSLLSSNSMGTSPTPHELSLKKIMDLKRLHISSEQTTTDTSNVENSPPNPTMDISQSNSIDLTCALNDPNFNQPIIPATKPVIEEIEFKFIDCDIAEKSNDNYQMSVSQDCNLNMLNILDQHFEKRTKSTTSFGRILCSKYKRKQKPLIQHGFINKHHVKPFNFDLKMKRIN